MRPPVSAAMLAALIVASGGATAACQPGKTQKCVNLDLVPQISQQIVASEHLAAPPKKAYSVEPIPAYTGPTVGINHAVRRAPQVGYRWAIE